MYQITRIIAPSAKLKIPPKSGASLQKRAKMAEDMMDNFHREIMPEFEKNGFISKVKLKKIYAKILPNIDVKLATYYPEEGSTFVAEVESKITNKDKKLTVFGYNIKLPFVRNFVKNVIKSDEAEPLFHETSHLIDFVTNPKFKIKMLFSRKSLDNKEKYWKFGNEVLYPGKNFKEQVLRSGKERKTLLKEHLNKLFEATGADSYEKIEILQNFRYGLKSEATAYTNGHIYRGGFEKSKPAQKIKADKTLTPEEKSAQLANSFEEWRKLTKQKSRNFLDDNYAFGKKIDIIEEVLKAELAKVRAEHQTKFKKCNDFLNI